MCCVVCGDRSDTLELLRWHGGAQRNAKYTRGMSTAEEQNESEYSNRVLYEGSESGTESKAGQRRAKGRAGNPWLPTSIVEAFLPSRALSCPLPHHMHTRLSRHVSHPRQCTQQAIILSTFTPLASHVVEYTRVMMLRKSQRNVQSRTFSARPACRIRQLKVRSTRTSTVRSPVHSI